MRINYFKVRYLGLLNLSFVLILLLLEQRALLASSPYPIGYFVTSTYEPLKANPGTCSNAVSAVATYIGTCNFGTCSGSNLNCKASLKYVNSTSITPPNFNITYVEFTSTNCTPTSIIPSSIKQKPYSTICHSSSMYTYVPYSQFNTSSLPISGRAGILQM